MTSPLTRNSLLKLLRPEALRFVEEHAIVRPMAGGEAVYRDGDPVTHTVFPLAGLISFVARRSDGRTIEKGNVGPEGFVGVTTMLERGTMYGGCVATLAGQAAWLPAAVFDEALDRFECVRLMLARYGKARIEQLHELIVCNSLHSADQRAARWLLDAFDKVGGRPFELKQEDLAELLGLRRATVSAACRAMMANGGIRYSRGRMELTGRPALEAMACDCYGHIRDRFAYKPLLRRGETY